MKDFNKFYKKLLEGKIYFDKFPQRRLLRYKNETLRLLKENIINKDARGLSCTLAVLFYDGADTDYTDILLSLLDQKWHILEEDIVEVLELIRDPKSVDKLYQEIINIPDYDDMRALAKKAIRALGAIGTNEAIDKLEQLLNVNDDIIKEAAFEQISFINKDQN